MLLLHEQKQQHYPLELLVMNLLNLDSKIKQKKDKYINIKVIEYQCLTFSSLLAFASSCNNHLFSSSLINTYGFQNLNIGGLVSSITYRKIKN
jgi:uncharacterized protein YuzB (UPF0349 family)